MTKLTIGGELTKVPNILEKDLAAIIEAAGGEKGLQIILWEQGIVRWRVFDILMDNQQGEQVSYYDMCAESPDMMFCDLGYISEDGFELRYSDETLVPLSKEVLQGFVQYLKTANSNIPTMGRFDCISFIMTLIWETDRTAFMTKVLHNTQEVGGDDDFQVGDIAFFVHHEFELAQMWHVHMALYLWRGMYLSKFHEGNIYCTNFEETMRQYPYAEAYRINL